MATCACNPSLNSTRFYDNFKCVTHVPRARDNLMPGVCKTLIASIYSFYVPTGTYFVRNIYWILSYWIRSWSCCFESLCSEWKLQWHMIGTWTFKTCKTHLQNASYHHMHAICLAWFKIIYLLHDCEFQNFLFKVYLCQYCQHIYVQFQLKPSNHI